VQPLAVDASGLVKRFGTVTALDAVDLRVESGEVHGLLGPNGAGKSTLLRLLFGLIRPESGTLRLFGSDASTPHSLDAVAGFVDSPRFYPYLSGRRNLQLLAAFDGGPAAGRVEEALDTVSLVDRAADKVGGYSTGMRQRLGVAAALLRDPRLLVLDEPASGLDPANSRDMRALVRRLAAAGLTVLLSSHDMAEVEDLCDGVTILRRGRVAYRGSLDQLRADAPNPTYRLRTSDDEAAVSVARSYPNLHAAASGGGLSVLAHPQELDAYVIALGRAGVAVRGLELESGALESLFFRLTEVPGVDSEPASELTGAVA